MYSKANRREVIKPEVLVVGIDVAKRHHVATIRLPDGTKKKAFSFSNDRSGFDNLLARAESVRASSGCTSILIGDVASISTRRLMLEYPSAADVARLEFKELYRLLRTWSIGHLHHEQCHRIHTAAKESVGITEGLYAARLEMWQTLKALEIVEGRIREVESAQHQALLQVPYAEHLLSIPQLAPVTVATILGETGDLRQYRNADAVIKLAGLSLYTKSSGIFKGKTRITRRGRPLLRQYLYLAALRLSKRGQPLTDFHDRLLPAKAKPQIAVALCRKLVRLMVAVVRDDVDYEVGRLAVDRTFRETVSAGGRTLANTG